MTRALVVTSLVLAPVLLPELAHAEPMSHACRFQFADHHRGWSVTESRRTIRCAFERLAPGNVTEALRIADRESSYYAHAWNRSTDCRGLFQMMERYWPARVRNLTRPAWFPRLWPNLSAFNARANAIVAARMVATGGWGPWA